MPNRKPASPPSSDAPLAIGGLLFPNVDQLDLTGAFEVLSRLPRATFRFYGKDTAPVRDVMGFVFTPDGALADAPPLDVLVVPGGIGTVPLMEDEETLAFLRTQAAGARLTLSICTGALLCGAAGLLRGRRATTHWNSFHLLPYFGATPVNDRVVVDGNHISAAGVTSSIDGALRAAALLAGQEVAESIQLQMQYAPEPPFQAGTPETAPAKVFAAAKAQVAALTAARLMVARRIAARLGVDAPADAG